MPRQSKFHLHRITALLLGFIIISSLWVSSPLGPGKLLAQNDREVFEWEDQRFRMRYPAGWEVRDDGSTFTFLADPATILGESIIEEPYFQLALMDARFIVRDDPAGPALATMRMYWEETDRFFGQRISQISRFDLRDYDAVRYDLQRGRVLYNRVLIVTGDRFFLITGVARLDDQAAFAPVFEDVIGSIIVSRAPWRIVTQVELRPPSGVALAGLLPSPDGQQLAYNAVQRGEFCRVQFALPDPHCFSVPFAFPRFDLLEPSSTPLMDWSPNNIRLVVSEPPQNNRNNQLWLANFEEEAADNFSQRGRDSGARNNVPLPPALQTSWPVFAPDGGRLAAFQQGYAGYDENSPLIEAGIVLLNRVNGLPEQTLFPLQLNNSNPDAVTGLAWSPDGLQLAATTDTGNDFQDGLTLIDVAAGTGQQVVTPGDIYGQLLAHFPQAEGDFLQRNTVAQDPAWTPAEAASPRLMFWVGDPADDERRLLFLFEPEAFTFTDVRLPAHPSPFFVRNAVPNQAAFSPDGRYLAVMAHVDLNPNPVILAQGEDEGTEAAAASTPPDSAAITQATRQAELYIIDLLNNQADRIEAFRRVAVVERLPRVLWTPDNSLLIYNLRLQLARN